MRQGASRQFNEPRLVMKREKSHHLLSVLKLSVIFSNQMSSRRLNRFGFDAGFVSH